ncbi:phage tail tape measure protein [Lysobacter sp. CA199]|uniref:phage tail tape measure protein n=1 Tax=Lysobacter sp. CA199 TaxID=3455608 RepID=UPI003F8D8A1E
MSSNNLKLQVLLAAIDRVTGPLRKITGGTNTTARALKAAKDRLRELDRAQTQMQGFRRLSAQATDSGNAMKAAHQRAAQLRASMAGVENPSQRAARALAKAERESTKLKNAHIGNLRALKSAKAELVAAGIEIKKLGENERRVRLEMTQTNAVIDKQRQKLARLATQNQRLHAAQAKMQKARRAAGAAAGAGAALGGAAAVIGAPIIAQVKAYASWEDAMLGVARQVQGARDGAGNLTPLYYSLGDAIKAMAERVPMATTEIAALVEAGARMGIQGRENLLAFAETTAVTANAFDLPVDEVGENMGKLAQLYKIPIRNISELGDAINWLDDNALAKGGDIIDVMQRLGSVADKLDFRKAAALGSTFLSLGAAPEIAASASNAMVRELSIATMQSKRFKAGLETLGLDARALQQGMVKDATGTILGVLDAIKKLPSDDQMTVATQLFGKEFGDDAAKLANNLSEYRRQLDLVNQSQARGSMQREASARLKNLSTGYTLLKNTLFNTLAESGAVLAPTLLAMMKSARDLLGQFRGWVKENPALAGGLVKTAASVAVLLAGVSGLALGIAGVLGPLAMVRYSATALGIRLQPLLASLRGLGARVLPVLANGARLLLPVLGGLSAPVLAVIAAVAAAGFLLWKYWQPIKAFMVGMWEGISAAVAPVAAEIRTALAPLAPLWDLISGAMGRAWNWLKELLTPFQATNEQLQNATGYGRSFGQVIGQVLAMQIRMLVRAVSWMVGAFSAAHGAIVRVLGGIWSYVQGAWAMITGIFSGDGGRIRAGLSQMWSGINAVLSGWPAKMMQAGIDMLAGLVRGIRSSLGAVNDAISGVGAGVVGRFKSLLGIHSPSRVFAELGGYTMQGYAGGLIRGQRAPLQAMQGFGKRIRQIGAGVAITAAATPAFAIDNRPPIASQGIGGGTSRVYEITINFTGAAPSVPDIEQAVRTAIDNVERAKSARQRSRLNDNGN